MKLEINSDFGTLFEAIEEVKTKGFNIEFIVNEIGFVDSQSGAIYLPENIYLIESIRQYAPLSDPDEESILYLLKTSEGKLGWISDTYGVYANTDLIKHLNEVKTTDATTIS